VIGSSLVLSGRPFTVVGVAPEDFPGSLRGFAPDFFAPIMMIGELMPLGGSPLESRGWNSFWPVGRLRAGATLAQAKGALSQVSPEVTAGCIAPFVWDRVQELELKIESPVDLKACEEAFDKVIHSIEGMRRLKVKRGFENPPIFFWPAAALYLWAKGVPWQQLLSIIPIDEGDMTSLIARTADHLRQVTNLRESHPRLASVAYTAIELILREPVFIE